MYPGWQRPRSWTEQLVGLCLTVLLCAVMLHVAVSLILSVWVALAVMGGVAGLLFVALAWWRSRAERW